MFPNVLDCHVWKLQDFCSSRSQMSEGGIFMHCAKCAFLPVNSDSCLAPHQNTSGLFQETRLGIHVLFITWTFYSRFFVKMWVCNEVSMAVWLLSWAQDLWPGYNLYTSKAALLHARCLRIPAFACDSLCARILMLLASGIDRRISTWPEATLCNISGLQSGLLLENWAR